MRSPRSCGIQHRRIHGIIEITLKLKLHCPVTDFFCLQFKNDTYFLDPCLNNTLLPATEAHKKHLSRLMQHLDTEDFANYTVALPVAFNLLARNDTARTSGCNKAIMIVSDNAPEAFEDICRLYNPDRSVRFFAYVIGREVTEYEGMTDLACNNRGFVAHITTIADVRDYVEVGIWEGAGPHTQLFSCQ